VRLAGIHHVGFTVTDLERTVAFYENVVGMRLVGRKYRRAPDLGTALMGAGRSAAPPVTEPVTAVAQAAESPAAEPMAAEILIADMALGAARVEFIQYLEPPATPYPGDPSVAGSAHIAILTEDIESERLRLEQAGVVFHTAVRTVHDPGKSPWKWCYFRDPDGICVELVQGGEMTEG
jgi:catechol 2,3-dioxygenase-like lactoylglutathione lyase family enzyme